MKDYPEIIIYILVSIIYIYVLCHFFYHAPIQSDVGKAVQSCLITKGHASIILLGTAVKVDC